MFGSEALGFDALIGQELPVHFLSTLLRKGTIPHALLFTGMSGIGKLTAAGLFAMACNCLETVGDGLPDRAVYDSDGPPPFDVANPCCRCRSCKKILSGNHPDVILVQPSGSFIKIAQIRTLCDTLAMKPHEASIRVILISDAQAMNQEAANALLKMLEEPPERTVFILTTPHISDLLPTVVSRCQQIRFNPISRNQIAAFLEEKHDLAPDRATLFAVMANGSLSRAMTIAMGSGGKGTWIKRRNWLIEEIEGLSLRSVDTLLALAEILSKKKETIADTFEVMITWFRDLVIYKYCPEKIINCDMMERIHHASLRFNVESLFLKINALRSAQRSIDANSNLRLTMEILLMRLARH